jgi:acetyl esterase
MSMPEQTRKFLEDISGFPPLHNMTPEEIRKVAVANSISEDFDLAGTEDVQLHGLRMDHLP